MDDITINADVTMSGEQGTLLAHRYRVVRQLGQGGMGSVWLAEDTQLDNRQVAIKMLPSILVSNKRAYNQLKSEALVSLKLTHSNIATVRAFEENDGNPFLVVDYIDGQTLDDYLAEKGKLPEDETIRLLTPIAAALDYAHGEGVVHRDVKPGNVMIRKDGHPFILDFGIAREIQETLTRVTGKLSSGTLMYMSPEQLHGEAPSASQDVYSFAAMAYECLTGTPPFSRGQIEYQIINDQPAGLPEDVGIASLIMGGLSKSAENRPSTCRAILSKVSQKSPLKNRVQPKPRDYSWSPNKDDEPTKRSSHFLVKLLPVVALFFLAGIGFWISKQRSESNVEPSASKSVTMVPSEAEESAIRAKTDAEMAIARIKNISRGQGLQPKFDKVVEEKKLADNYMERSVFVKAIDGYHIVVRVCDSIRELNEERTKALLTKGDASMNKAEAEKHNAKQYAVRIWNRAESTFETAQRQFDAGEFSAAFSNWQVAAEAYDESRLSADVEELSEKRKRQTAKKERPVEVGANKTAETIKVVPTPAKVVPAPVKVVAKPVQKVVSDPAQTARKDMPQKTILLPNDIPIEMVWCGPSEFEIKPGVMLSMKGFWIAKYELTQKQWCSVMRDNPSYFTNSSLPVENLSWNDCTLFLTTLNAHSKYTFRMPRGVEWEYAARGGPKGEMKMPIDEFAWWGRNSGDRTHQGGGKRPNSLGLYDVLGNVWEWCADVGKDENFGKRELRGGSYCNNNQKLISATVPMFSEQDVKGYGAGLRIVCDNL